MTEFFSSTMAFKNYRTGTPETVKEGYFRQEIWIWMEASLSKGQYKYVVKTIEVIFDIHALYLKIVSLANKASWISHALEYRKIFTMEPSNGDIQYHVELQDQIKPVQSQAQSLGIDSSITPWVPQGLLLVAAWNHPTYRKLAMDFTMDNKAISCDLLIKELQKHQLLTSHLNSSRNGDRREKRSENREIRVRAANVAPNRGVCFDFQKGKCTRVPNALINIQSLRASRLSILALLPQASGSFITRKFAKERISQETLCV